MEATTPYNGLYRRFHPKGLLIFFRLNSGNIFLQLLGERKSFAISRTPLYRGVLIYRGSVAINVHILFCHRAFALCIQHSHNVI